MAGMDLRELAASRRRHLGDAQSGRAFHLLEGHELGCAGSWHPPGGEARVAGQPRQMAPAARPHLRRSDEPRLESKASRVHSVLWKRGPGCLTLDHAIGFLYGPK